MNSSYWTMAVEVRWYLRYKPGVFLLARKVASGSQRQMRRHASLQVAMGRLDVAVLVGTCLVDRAWLQLVVLTQLEVFRVKAALFARPLERVRGRRAMISLKMGGHAAQFPQCRAQASLQRQELFRARRHCPFPVRVGQHRVAQQVRERLPGDLDLQIAGICPIEL